jgi:hypothetical protein
LEIHFIAVVSAKKKPEKQVDFLRFRGPVLGGNPLLGKFKGFLVNQRFMGIGKEMLPFLCPMLRRRYLAGFLCQGAAPGWRRGEQGKGKLFPLAGAGY